MKEDEIDESRGRNRGEKKYIQSFSLNVCNEIGCLEYCPWRSNEAWKKKMGGGCRRLHSAESG